LPYAVALLATGALASVALSQGAANPAVTVAVDASADRKPINPMVYGVSFGSQAELAELRSPVVRWGGNHTTRYNWQQNADNRGSDWYFESVPYAATAGDEADKFVQQAKAAGAQPMLTVPIINYVAKVGANRQKLASFSVAKYGPQQSTDSQWFPDAGNGVRPDGTKITGNDPQDASVPNSSALQQQWAQHLVNRWGTASSGGVRYYVLDNEHTLWHQTHRDVHPSGATMEEVRNLMIDYAQKLRAVDPAAQLAGPEEWGWLAYFYSGYDQQTANQGQGYGPSLPDRASHGGMEYMPWLLQQLKAAENQTGTKMLDIFTLHIYPQGGELSNDVSQTMQLKRNRSTRALWDPNYVDETWINDRIRLIPRMRQWVAQYYPGLKTGITEYNWGAEGHINGATAQADILGIFGREGLDVGTRWTMPSSGGPVFKAMKMWRNYDNAGGAFGETSVRAAVPNADQLSAFAAQRADGKLTVMVVNKVLTGATPVTISLAGFTPGGSAGVWQLTSANAINRLSDVPASGQAVSLTVPPQSVTMVVIPGGGDPNPNPTPTPTPNPTPTPSPTPTPVPPNPGGPYGNGGLPWPVSASVTTRIQAENFDEGGEGVGYHDADAGNNGGKYRATGVDVETTADTGGGFDVGYVNAGEWLHYTVDVAAAGSYELKLRTARQPGGDSLVRVLFGGADKTGDVPVPSTGGWQTWRDVTKVVTLAAGPQVMRVHMAGSQLNLNWIELRPTSAPSPNPTPTPGPTPQPGGRTTYGNNGQPWPAGIGTTTRVQAENYDQGGPNVAYHDTTSNNVTGKYRPNEGVDIEQWPSGAYSVGHVDSGEWLEYSLNVAAAGSYELKLRAARKSAGGSSLKVLFGGVDRTGSWTVPSTGGWDTWSEITKTVTLTAGPQFMRVHFLGKEINFDWLEIRGTGGTPSPNPTPTPTPTPPPGSAALVYEDVLPAEWQDWSWGSTRNFAGTTAVKSGARSIDLTLQPWGALSLRRDVALPTAGYTQLHFWVYNAGSTIVPFRVVTQTADTSGQGPAAPYSAQPGGWTEVWIPFANLGYPVSVKRLSIQEATGALQPTLQVDRIELIP
jgi:hypothetical protein